jgi:TorA maturation chaperone TorD
VTTLYGATKNFVEGSEPGRWELLRALGSLTLDGPLAHSNVATSLGLEPLSPAQYSELFVLSLPPFAGIHLGPEGKLGDEGADRVAGFWRTLGLDPPTNADHLGVLLALYAELGEAECQSSRESTRLRLGHVRSVLLWEHVWPWVPGYLEAASRENPLVVPWARLSAQILTRETHLTAPATTLALALRTAPAPIGVDNTLDEFLDALTAPVRTGFILTYGDLQRACSELGLGLRRGERRYALRAMVEQDSRATLDWLGRHAREWQRIHRRRPVVPLDPGAWWCARAGVSALAFAQLSAMMST